MDNKFNLRNKAVQTGLVALIAAATIVNVIYSKKVTSTARRYENTADYIGNRDGKVSDTEKQLLDFLISEARKHNVKNAYVPFVIDSEGKTYSTNPVTTGDTLPYINPNSLKLTEYPGISPEELVQRINLGKELPRSKEWTTEDFYNHFGFYEIDQKGELTAIYTLTKKGMMKEVIFQ